MSNHWMVFSQEQIPWTTKDVSPFCITQSESLLKNKQKIPERGSEKRAGEVFGTDRFSNDESISC